MAGYAVQIFGGALGVAGGGEDRAAVGLGAVSQFAI
jgi:hypothetical protein